MKPGQEQALAMQHGTLAYMPPELITDDALSFATDVYSFGILLWEMFSAKVLLVFHLSVEADHMSVMPHALCMNDFAVLLPSCLPCHWHVGFVKYLQLLQHQETRAATAMVCMFRHILHPKHS